jgi:hypothetical protein
MEKQQLYEMINAFIKGELPIATAELFAQEIATDLVLSEQISIQRLEHEAGKLLREKELRNKMKAWETDNQSVTTSTWSIMRGGRATFAIAAGLVTILAAVLFLKPWNSGKSTDNIATSLPETKQNPTHTIPQIEKPVAQIEKPNPQVETPQTKPQKPIKEQPNLLKNTENYLALAETYYKNPNFEANIRGGESQNNPLEAGIITFNKGEYQKSKDFFNNTLLSEDDTPYAQLYKGLIAFKLKEYKTAITLLTELSQSNAYLLPEEAEWYLLLTYLADNQDDTTVFKNLLSKVKNNKNHAHCKEAEKLMSSLLDK